MLQFTREGQDVEGVLLSIQPVRVKDKEAIQYLLRLDSGERVTFLGTYDLNRKIHAEHKGHAIMVRYGGEDKTVATQGSPLRRFKVFVSKERELAVKDDPLRITDEDIPF